MDLSIGMIHREDDKMSVQDMIKNLYWNQECSVSMIYLRYWLLWQWL